MSGRKIRKMRPSHLRPHCHAEESVRLTIRPSAFVSERFRHTYNGKDGRFFDFAQNDSAADQQSNHSPLEGESQKPSRSLSLRSLSLSKGRRVGDG